jgi:hypothetical protein
MIQTVLLRNLSFVIACSDGVRWVRGGTSHGWQDKSPDLRPGHVLGWIGILVQWGAAACRRLLRKAQRIQRVERRQPSFWGHRSP